MVRVYFAAPLFCEAEKKFNEELVSVLEGAGYSVFLPQRDGLEAAAMGGLDEAEVSRRIFEADISEIKRADVLFMMLDGRVPDEGACVELGYAHALGKPCYGIRTDVRAAERGLALNPMIWGCFKHIIDCPAGGAAEALKEFLAANGLQ